MKIQILSHNCTGNALVVVAIVDGVSKTKMVESTHPNWRQVMDLYRLNKLTDMIALMDMEGAIAAKFKGAFTVVNGAIHYKGVPAHGYLIDRLLFFMRELPNQAERLLRFAENLYQNPDPRVIEQLYRFLEHKHMPITEDGCFLAYKGVGSDYYSHTSGSIRVLKGQVKSGRIWNGVGAHIIVERKGVCADPNIGCSSGLHVGSWEYADNFKGSGFMMVVKVNPKHVCSVPTDCSWQKCRTCEYEVIAQEGGKLHSVKDSNFDKVVKLKLHRDSLGRFAKAPSVCRDALGRFAAKG